MKYSTGDEVTWTSKSGGSTILKTGTIAGFCLAGDTPVVMLEGERLPDTSPRWKSAPSSSIHDRYLIKVPRGGKSILWDIYAPHTLIVDRS